MDVTDVNISILQNGRYPVQSARERVRIIGHGKWVSKNERWYWIFGNIADSIHNPKVMQGHKLVMVLGTGSAMDRLNHIFGTCHPFCHRRVEMEAFQGKAYTENE